ncbi:MAG: YkvA family protein [Candidatus Sericytochromatia bacterium]
MSGKEDNNKKYVGLWEHEIIHMLDFKLITNFREDRNKLMKNEFKPTPNYSPFFDINDKPKDYWFLLDIINLMRVEGLATLYECLLGLREDSIHSFENFKENLMFQFKVVINFVESVKFLKSNQHKQQADLIKLIRSLCYETGKWIVLYILSNKEEIDCNTASKEILNTGNFKVNSEECNSIMKEALKIDFTEFLSMLLQLSNPEKQFFNSYQLLEDIGNLSGGKISNQVSNDLFLLYCTSRANNKKAFIEILSKYVGAKMKEEEIIASYADFKTYSKSDNYIENTLYTKTSELYERWKSDKQNELLVYALTYILDDEDMIPDDIKFLGYLDDMAVIDSVEFLLANNN